MDSITDIRRAETEITEAETFIVRDLKSKGYEASLPPNPLYLKIRSKAHGRGITLSELEKRSGVPHKDMFFLHYNVAKALTEDSAAAISAVLGVSADFFKMAEVGEVQKRKEESMANPHLTDEQVEKEIARLRKSRFVALARREERVRCARRQILYNLRSLEKKGRELESSGITMGVLDALERDVKV